MAEEFRPITDAEEGMNRLADQDRLRARDARLARDWFKFPIQFFERIRDGRVVVSCQRPERPEWVPVPFYTRDIGSAIQIMLSFEWPTVCTLRKTEEGRWIAASWQVQQPSAADPAGAICAAALDLLSHWPARK